MRLWWRGLFFTLCFVHSAAFANDSTSISDFDLADQVERMNSLSEVNKSLDPTPHCDSCTPKPNPQYQTCNDRNDYLESSLQKILNPSSWNADQLLESSGQNPQLQTCVRESLSSHGGPFRTCDANGKGLAKGRSLVKPCQSENLVKTLTSSYAATIDCLTPFMTDSNSQESKGILSHSVFSLLAFESGFHMNAVSPTGASGIGQLTGPAVQHINHILWPKMMNAIQSSTEPSCQAIAKTHPQPYDGRKSLRCEMISADEGNPLRNLLYTFAYQKAVRDDINSGLRSLHADNAGVQALQKASPEFHERLLEAITIWGHNTGPAGIRMPFKYLLTSSQGRQLIEKEDLPGFLKALQPIVETYHRDHLHVSEQRAKEASHFMGGIESRLKVINQRAGAANGEAKCGI